MTFKEILQSCSFNDLLPTLVGNFRIKYSEFDKKPRAMNRPKR
jgi:hypothetical protein